MGEYFLYKSSLSPQVSELAILRVAREWNSPVEWAIHQTTVLKAGVSQAVIDAVASRSRLTGLSDGCVCGDG
jgi:4-carboxymuconolactone decarboxylase